MGNACFKQKKHNITKVVVRRITSYSHKHQPKKFKNDGETSEAFKTFKETGLFADLMKDHDFFYFLRGFLLHDFAIEARGFSSPDIVHHIKENDLVIESSHPSKKARKASDELNKRTESTCSNDLEVVDLESSPMRVDLRKKRQPSREKYFSMEAGNPVCFSPVSESRASIPSPLASPSASRLSMADDGSETRTLALRFLAFYADTTDYKAMFSSEFKALRAEKIADTYIRHGAPSRLPLPRLLREEIERKIDANSYNPPPHTFDDARAEAKDFLEAEIWPVLKGSVLLKRWKDGTAHQRQRVYSLSALAPKNNEKYEMATEPLAKALGNSEFCVGLKNFLRRFHPGDVSSLLFYLEVLDFENMFQALIMPTADFAKSAVPVPAPSSPKDLDDKAGAPRQRSRRNAVPHTNAPFLMMRASKLYDKYLKLGARQEVPITRQMKEDIREALSTKLTGRVFETAKEVSFRVLFERYREFLHSQDFADYENRRQEKAERRRKALRAAKNKLKALKMIKGSSSSSLLMKASPLARSSRKLLNLSGDADGKSTRSDSSQSPNTTRKITLKQDSSNIPKDSETVTLGESLDESTDGGSAHGKIPDKDADFKQKMLDVYKEYFFTLKEANKLHHFQRHLETVSLHHYFVFYMEVEEYRMIPYTQAGYMKGRAHKIYEKYLKLSALLEIYLPEAIKNRILVKLPEPTSNMFTEAQQNVFETLLEEWPLFMQTDGYKELVEEGALDSTTSTLAAKYQEVDIPLYILLEDQMMANLFKEFCDQEFYPQTVRFWLEVEDFKRTPSGPFLETRCHKLINMYIKEGALSTVPISNETRAAIEKGQITPGPNLFEPAQEEVYKFMVSTLYGRFKATEPYISNLGYLDQLARKDSSLEESRDGDLPPRFDMSRRESQVISEEATSITHLLHTQTGCRYFKEFCEQIYCPEMIFFWMEVEDYKQVPGEMYMARFARKIVNKYVADHARMQINISHKAQVKVLKGADKPTRDLFDEAQDEVVHMMEKDTLPKFRVSKHYEEYVNYQRTKKDQRRSQREF